MNRLWELDGAYMNTRYVAAKLFFVLASLCALVGAALFQRSVIGIGLTIKEDLNPLFLVMIPRLIPFAVSILSVCFGLVYFAFEKKFKRPVSVSLALVHLVSFLLAVLGHATLVHFWWRVLGEEHATNTPLPLWAGMLMIAAFAVCCLVFAVNIFWSMSRAPLVASNPR